jgi:hypothetical protein
MADVLLRDQAVLLDVPDRSVGAGAHRDPVAGDAGRRELRDRAVQGARDEPSPNQRSPSAPAVIVCGITDAEYCVKTPRDLLGVLFREPQVAVPAGRDAARDGDRRPGGAGS